MENIKIKIASGKIVTLEAFHMTTTYGGLITGVPSEETNEKIIKNITYPSNWGKRKAVFDKSDIYHSEDVLKPLVFSVWLSAKPINNKANQFDGSSIIVTWFGDIELNKSIKEIIVYGLGMIDWDKHAENFNF